MYSFFQKRGYPSNVIDRALDTVSTQDRASTLKKRNNVHSDRVPLVLNFHPHNVAIQNILIRNFKKIVLEDAEMAEVFQSRVPITAFRRGKSLRDHLVSSTLQPADRRVRADYRGTRRCTRSVCKTCPHTLEITNIRGPANTFTIQN